MIKSFKQLVAILTAILAMTNQAIAVEIQQFHLDNGAKVLLVERHEIPIVDINIIFDAGSRRDDINKIGVAKFTGALMNKSAGKYNEEQLREKIADLAISINSYAGLETAGLSIRSLSNAQTLNDTIQLANIILTKPQFDDKILKREKARSILNWKQAQTRPKVLASQKLIELNYGHHPYGYAALENEQTISAINAQDLKQFHQQYYLANQAIIAVVGDINKQQAKTIADNLLKGLAKGVEKFPAIAAVTQNKVGQMVNIQYPSTQANILMSMPIIQVNDPDYFALIVGNFSLGAGGFSSRLMKELRDEHGYTYGVASYFSPREQLGTFSVGYGTKNETAQESLAVSRKIIADFVKQGPTTTELQAAKDNLIGSFPLRIDTNNKLVGQLSHIGFYNLPLDYLDSYSKKVDELSTTDIKKAWQKRINPDKINTIIVSDHIEKTTK